MKGNIFRIENGMAYINDPIKGYGLEECLEILNNMVDIINSGKIIPMVKKEVKPSNIIEYEEILNQRIIDGKSDKMTLKLKEWLDNDPDVIEEDRKLL